MLKMKQMQISKHSPTLNTVLMVEETIRKADGLMTVAELKRALPKKVMHSTLLEILSYLQLSGKIAVTVKGVLWIFTPRKELDEIMLKNHSDFWHAENSSSLFSSIKRGLEEAKNL